MKYMALVRLTRVLWNVRYPEHSSCRNVPFDESFLLPYLYQISVVLLLVCIFFSYCEKQENYYCTNKVIIGLLLFIFIS